MAIEFHIHCEDNRERNIIGSALCNALVGSPGYISNEILVNYTDPDHDDICMIVGTNNTDDVVLEIDSSDLTLA